MASCWARRCSSVADAAKVARSVAAEVLGYQMFDPDLNVAGVILNGVGSPAHLAFCQPQIEVTTGLPVLGYLPRRSEFEQPERHLGLIPTVEGIVARQWYDTLIAQVEETIDVGRIVELARYSASLAPSHGDAPQVYPAKPQTKRAIIAVVQDKAFNFYYQDSLDLLEAWGAEIVPFSPLEDESLPEGAGGVYLGGGSPELFAAKLSANRPMLDSIRQASERGVPVYGECGGLMYLGRSLTGFDGEAHPMAGLLPAASAMSQSRLSLGYREVEALSDGPLLASGQQVRGHEFHWSTLEQPPQDDESVYRRGQPRRAPRRISCRQRLGHIRSHPLGQQSRWTSPPLPTWNTKARSARPAGNCSWSVWTAWSPGSYWKTASVPSTPRREGDAIPIRCPSC